ncbi:MAG: AAA family ATPase [Patescibacteria group bacterium]
MNISPRSISQHPMYSVVALDYKFSHPLRDTIDKVLNGTILIFTLLIAVAYGLAYVQLPVSINVDPVIYAAPYVLGMTLILVALYLSIFVIELFFRHSYLQDEAPIIGPTFDVLKVLYRSNRDITRAFVNSEAGQLILLRCGITPQMVQSKLLAQKTTSISDLNIPDTIQGPITLAVFVHALLASDAVFRTFIVDAGSRDSELIGSAEWYAHSRAITRTREQWWTRERLATVQSIGRDWAYSAAYTLQRFGREIIEHYDAAAVAMSLKDTEEVAALERILARAHGADAIVVGPNEDAARDVVYNFARSIARGTVTPELEGKKIYTLDYNIMASVLHTKAEYEVALVSLLNNAVRAKNIILVISNFAAFLEHARSIGSDAVQILEPYFSSPSLQIIATVDLDSFQNTVESNMLITSKMEKVEIAEPSRERMISQLERSAEHIEARTNVLFTYGAIEEALTSADNYLPYGVMPDKAIDLLVGVAPRVVQQNKVFVVRGDILALVQSKTHIPVGEIHVEERAKLLSLEEYLHQRVVGQDEAIKVIASALRRARAGVRNMKRPMGSALFLGPTGVGKTETVKALAELFFQSEQSILRFDMSEYQTADALERLIGFSQGAKVGTLTKALKDKPYGVLFLDEFEKANRNILDLFLQILDEGVFSDMQGKHVSARNVIIVATSNAGSDLIWEAQEHGADMSATKSQIIDKLIERGIYTPELLNRFDAIVLFNPLTAQHLTQIAHLMLQKLQVRMREKNLELVITDDLVNAAVKFGTDKQFGARPMNRAIQEKIEQAIADKLIRGEIREGSQVIIGPEELG